MQKSSERIHIFTNFANLRVLANIFCAKTTAEDWSLRHSPSDKDVKVGWIRGLDTSPHGRPFHGAKVLMRRWGRDAELMEGHVQLLGTVLVELEAGDGRGVQGEEIWLTNLWTPGHDIKALHHHLLIDIVLSELSITSYYSGITSSPTYFGASRSNASISCSHSTMTDFPRLVIGSGDTRFLCKV